MVTGVPYGMRELRHADAGRSHVLSPARCDNSRISALVRSRFHQRGFYLMNLRRALTRPIIAQIVDIHAVNHVRDAPLASHFIEPGEQFVLAVETAVGTVLDVIRILKLARGDVFVPESLLARELLGIALVRFGKRCGIGRDRDRPVAQSLVRRPRQIRRIGAAGIGYDDAAQIAQRR